MIPLNHRRSKLLEIKSYFFIKKIIFAASRERELPNVVGSGIEFLNPAPVSIQVHDDFGRSSKGEPTDQAKPDPPGVSQFTVYSVHGLEQ